MTRRWGGVARLTVGGGLGFWVANLAISLTPIAAEYRAALAIPYVPMLFEALVGGLVIALAVSVALVRAGDALPTASPVAKAILLSLVALVVVTLVVAVPSNLLMDSGDPLRYFLIATAFNAVRITALGVAIGVLHRSILRSGGKVPLYFTVIQRDSGSAEEHAGSPGRLVGRIWRRQVTAAWRARS